MKKLLTLLVVLAMIGTVLITPMVGADNDVDGAGKYLKEKFKGIDVSKDIKKVKVKQDELGLKHVKVQQMVGNLPVYGQEYIVHLDSNDNVYYANGSYSEKAKNYKAKGEYIKEKDAMDIAKTDINFIPSAEVLQEDVVSSEMYLYEVDGEFVPVYLVKINWLHENSFGDWRVFVNADNGEVVEKYNNIKNGKPQKPISGTDVVGTGTGVLNDTKDVNLTLSSGVYYLQDTTRSQMDGVFTYDANNRTRLPGTLMTDTDSVWDSTRQKAGVDAQVYAGDTYDYYYNMFGRNSIDDNGMAIKSTVHYSTNYVNAFWNGSQMVYGDGDNYNSIELSGALDVIAHEMSHGVTDNESDLQYLNQSGALNEAFSDILGAAVEFHVQGNKGDWLLGEDVWTPGINGDALRSMSDPNLYGDPDHMSEFVYTTADNGGVHTNSGIINKAGYLIGSQIGTDKMAAIFYRANCVYWTTTTNFSQARATCLQSASDLYGYGSNEYNKVAAGFDGVGVY